MYNGQWTEIWVATGVTWLTALRRGTNMGIRNFDLENSETQVFHFFPVHTIS